MKQWIKKGLFYLMAGFVALFAVRLAYGYLAPSSQQIPHEREALSEAVITNIGGRDNYASEKLKVQRGGGVESLSIDQKYEKVASVVSKTGAFEDDENKVRELTSKHNALIQFEQSSGLPGSRRVNVAIGVPPDRFDAMVSELKTIGELSSIRIDKTDKTNEYKELKANRASLEKTRDALVALKSKGGNIEEFTNLENRILEIEQSILDHQVLRVAAGLIAHRDAVDAGGCCAATAAQRDTAASGTTCNGGQLRVNRESS